MPDEIRSHHQPFLILKFMKSRSRSGWVIKTVFSLEPLVNNIYTLKKATFKYLCIKTQRAARVMETQQVSSKLNYSKFRMVPPKLQNQMPDRQSVTEQV